MYFHDRGEAGQLLAQQLAPYRFEDVSVVALSPHGVVVGAAIATELHCDLSLLVVQKIAAQGEPGLVMGSIDQEGEFTSNNLISTGQMEEYLEDMRGYLEEEKLHKLYDMVQLLDHEGIVDRTRLVNRTIILACEGVNTGMSYQAAKQFLKPVSIRKTVAAIPVGPIEAIEQIGQMVDELHYLYIPDNYLDVHHYYEDNQTILAEEVLNYLRKHHRYD